MTTGGIVLATIATVGTAAVGAFVAALAQPENGNLIAWLLGALAAGNGALGAFLMRMCWRLLGSVDKATKAGSKLADAVKSIEQRIVEHEEKDERMHGEYSRERDRAKAEIRENSNANTARVEAKLEKVQETIIRHIDDKKNRKGAG